MDQSINIINKYQTITGWNDESTVIILCRFIDKVVNKQADCCGEQGLLETFLKEATEEELQWTSQ